MSNGAIGYTCRQKTWALAAVLAVLVLVLLVTLAGWGLLPALLVAVLLCVLLGFVLPAILCGKAGDTAAAAPAAPVAEPAPAAAPVAAAAPAAPEPAPAADAPGHDKGGAQDGAAEGRKPGTLSGPRGGKADNLKEIKGIGPKLETMLNGMGFYHFDQIAGWTAEEVAWVDANLTGFRGRVSRDGWVAQAGVLAAGGETEFSKRVDDGDVY